jgi:hypothetical protein
MAYTITDFHKTQWFKMGKTHKHWVMDNKKKWHEIDCKTYKQLSGRRKCD